MLEVFVDYYLFDSDQVCIDLRNRSRRRKHLFLDEFILVPLPLLVFMMVTVDQDGLPWLLLLYGVFTHTDCGSIDVLLSLLLWLTFIAWMIIAVFG